MHLKSLRICSVAVYICTKRACTVQQKFNIINVSCKLTDKKIKTPDSYRCQFTVTDHWRKLNYWKKEVSNHFKTPIFLSGWEIGSKKDQTHHFVMAIQPFFSPFFSVCSSPSLRVNTPWIQSSHLCHQHGVQSPRIPCLILQEPANPRTIMRNISMPIDYSENNHVWRWM